MAEAWVEPSQIGALTFICDGLPKWSNLRGGYRPF